jgi:hypothetical protein
MFAALQTLKGKNAIPRQKKTQQTRKNLQKKRKNPQILKSRCFR